MRPEVSAIELGINFLDTADVYGHAGVASGSRYPEATMQAVNG